jgi:hypothetical protein
MIEITESDYNQYMFLLEEQIKDYCYKINELYVSLDKLINNNSIYGKYEGSLTIEEIQKLIKSFTEYQHNYFIKWYNLNKTLQQKELPYYLPAKIRDIGSYIKGVVRYNDLLTA